MHEREQMPRRLADFLMARRDDVEHVEVISYEPMAGGYSRSMARARVRYQEGDVALEEVLVLRGDPPPGHSMIDTDRDYEWMVLDALTELPEIPIPAARYYDGTGEQLGTKAIVMDHVHGGSLQSIIEDTEDWGEHPERLARLWGTIHTITPDRLPDAMPSPASYESRVDELLGMWWDTERNGINNDPVLRYATAWLEANRPPPLPMRLCHGDPQAPNVMVDDDGEYQLVDWEFATIGDPREDLGWYNLYSNVSGPNLYAADPDRFLEAYREVTGFDEAAVNELTVGYFSILGSVRIASTIWEQVDLFTRGENSGSMTALQVGSLSVGHPNFLDGIAGMQAAIDALEQAR